nr:hypothetical protein CFP56_50379 [Quercus suber]
MAQDINVSSTLLRLPDELLFLVVAHTIPEGFESLSLTCKRIFAVCEPSIKHHNELDRQYRRFSYRLVDPSFPLPITTAFHLIARIIAEPTVARYIRHADFQCDTVPFYIYGEYYDSETEEMHVESVVSFVAKSSILRSTGWDEHAAAHVIEEDLCNRRYSQHAATFLLTMLPNVESLVLPLRWESNEMSNALLTTVIRSAVAHDGTVGIDCSLGKTKTLRNLTPCTSYALFPLEWAMPFLRLPCIQSVHGNSIVESASSESMPPHGMPFAGMATGLRSLELRHCCLRLDSLCSLLRSAPGLKSLCYSHTVKYGMAQEWDFTDYLNAIAGLTGTHLEELSVLRSQDVRVQRSSELSISSQFLCLRLLELPLDIFGRIHPITDLHYDAPVVSYMDVVPKSITKLAFYGKPSNLDAGQGLESFFHGLAKARQTVLPQLEELHMACPDNSNDGWKSRCRDLQAECEGIGVKAHLHCLAFRLM